MLSVTLAAFVGKEALLAIAPVRGLPVDALVLVRGIALGGYYAVQLLAVRWLADRRGSSLGRALGGRARSLAERFAVLARVVLVVVGARAFGILYGLLMRQAGFVPDSSALLKTFGGRATGLVLAAVLVVCVGPVIEEIVFRGVLLQGLMTRLGAWPAIAVQAVVFAALHRSVWLFVPMTALGAALGWLAWDRESIRPAIVAHAAYNAITVAAAFALRG
ncbi:MAG: CPBP family intramembrane metalloprotease [Coriobacteriia bacterium]|nr:CPBP family intramembrane metalloprotease [Coriobacteriia bacterium]